MKLIYPKKFTIKITSVSRAEWFELVGEYPSSVGSFYNFPCRMLIACGYSGNFFIQEQDTTVKINVDHLKNQIKVELAK